MNQDDDHEARAAVLLGHSESFAMSYRPEGANRPMMRLFDFSSIVLVELALVATDKCMILFTFSKYRATRQ